MTFSLLIFMKKIPIGIKLSKPENLPKEKFGYTADHLKYVMKQTDKIIEIRGQIIGGTLYVENKINEIILKYFFEKQNKKKDIFQELVLEKEFFTLIQKWKIFRELLNRNVVKISNEKNKKEILRLIHEVIEIRNRFTHGCIDFEYLTPVIEYLKNGEKKKDILDKKYFCNVSKIFNQACDLLDQIEIVHIKT